MRNVRKLILGIIVLLVGSSVLFLLEIRSRHSLFLTPLYSYLVQFVTYFLLGLLIAPARQKKASEQKIFRAMGLLSLIIIVLPLIPLTYLSTVSAFLLHAHLVIIASFFLGCTINAEYQFWLGKPDK